ncbi:MAG: bifunctional 4-hydroxy-2-oxoglutarate aldolase/2-dehydro-3-deoxy-phosphogluconate aldolase [Blastocatellia bacterium]
MKKTEVLKRIEEVGIIPVVRASSVDEALGVAEAIKAGGVAVLEITMTVPHSVNLIERLADRYGSEVLVGAGTVLDRETARSCILAGASFVVSPSLDPGTVETCRRYSVAVFPGALTPTEVVSAWQCGADAVKVFPCSAVGGASYLRALKAPLPQVELIPTGGVSLATAAEFIKAGAFALGVGSDLVDTNAIRAGQPGKVTDSARAYIAAVQAARSSLVKS